MSLYQEDGHQRLTTDPMIYTPSSDGRLLKFLPYRTGIAPAFRRDAIIVGPRPLVPQTPSQAVAMQQHQQQMAQQSATIGMPQTTGTPISMQQQMKKPVEEADEQCAVDKEVSWQIHDRWLFDSNNEPSVTDVLDEFHPKCVFRA